MQRRHQSLLAGIEEAGGSEIVAGLIVPFADGKHLAFVLDGRIVTVSKPVAVKEQALLERLCAKGEGGRRDKGER